MYQINRIALMETSGYWGDSFGIVKVQHLFSNCNFLSPVQSILSSGTTVLDIGCGPGTWIMEMAVEYPRTKFYGIDMFKMFPSHIVPANCYFQTANALEALPYSDQSFGFVFIRDLGLAVYQKEWPSLITEVLRVLKPGGYLELVETDYFVQGEGEAFGKISNGLYNALRARDIHPSWTQKIGDYLNTMHMEDVNSFPQSFPVAQVMYISGEEYDELLRGVYQELLENGVHIKVICTYGRKPPQIGHEMENVDCIKLCSDK
ncbi:uncharacterized protein VTP21DRAFT_7663 [Calcarisporiella thermophila]|uniref:uncharacterized protein n=1 Tax=Calcarisporiella thermophila TaxID=911321 RepID=UPI003742E166